MGKSLKSEIEIIWDENMKLESEILRLRVKIEDEQNGQIIKMENSKRFISLLEMKMSTVVDSHFMPDGDHTDTNSLKPPEMITKSRSPRTHVSRSSTLN